MLPEHHMASQHFSFGIGKVLTENLETVKLNAAFDKLPSTCSGPEPVERQASQSRNP